VGRCARQRRFGRRLRIVFVDLVGREDTAGDDDLDALHPLLAWLCWRGEGEESDCERAEEPAESDGSHESRHPAHERTPSRGIRGPMRDSIVLTLLTGRVRGDTRSNRELSA
jgi:hypothetical protein